MSPAAHTASGDGPAPDRAARRSRGRLRTVLHTVLMAFALAVVIRVLAIQPFVIPSGSMAPTLLPGDMIVVTKWSWGYSRFSAVPAVVPVAHGHRWPSLEAPQPGDVAVFRSPRTPGQDLIKRVIAGPGATVSLRDGQVLVDGAALERTPLGTVIGLDGAPLRAWREVLPDGRSWVVWDTPGRGRHDSMSAVRVPEGHYFVLGDHRDNSADSRDVLQMGVIPIDHFLGRASVVVASWQGDAVTWSPATWLTALRPDRLALSLEQAHAGADGP